MKRVRIYTEDKNILNLTKIIRRYFGGYTIFKTIGTCNYTAEMSICIEIIESCEIDLEQVIVSICKEIKVSNNQESVLYTIENVQAAFV